MKNSKYVSFGDVLIYLKISEIDLWSHVQDGEIIPISFDEDRGHFERIKVSKLKFSDFKYGRYNYRSISQTPSYHKILFDKNDLQTLIDTNSYLKEAIDDHAKQSKIDVLDPKKLRKLGQLELEKEKWDRSIEAAVLAAVFAVKADRRITKRELLDELHAKGFKDLPDTTFRKIFKSIPEKLKNNGGRPPIK